MEGNDRFNLLIVIGLIFFGINIIRFESLYSIKYRMTVHFVSSPVKEIFGVLCILWGLYLLCLIIKKVGFGVFKIHAPLLAATLITLATILYLFENGSFATIVIVLPILVFEFAVIYIVGLHLHKRLGWDGN